MRLVCNKFSNCNFILLQFQKLRYLHFSGTVNFVIILPPKLYLSSRDAACDKLDKLIANVESKEASGKIDSDLADIIIGLAESIKDDIGIC